MRMEISQNGKYYQVGTRDRRVATCYSDDAAKLVLGALNRPRFILIDDEGDITHDNELAETDYEQAESGNWVILDLFLMVQVLGKDKTKPIEQAQEIKDE